MRSTAADSTVASIGYVLPPNVTELTANSITILSFAFSLRLRAVTVRFTVAPAGITAPLLPVTAFSTVAVTLSPTLFVFVQIRDAAFVVMVAPAGIIPTAPPPDDDGFEPAL